MSLCVLKGSAGRTREKRVVERVDHVTVKCDPLLNQCSVQNPLSVSLSKQQNILGSGFSLLSHHTPTKNTPIPFPCCVVILVRGWGGVVFHTASLNLDLFLSSDFLLLLLLLLLGYSHYFSNVAISDSSVKWSQS